MAKSSVLCMVILACQNNHTGVFIRWMRGYLLALTLVSDSAMSKKKQLHGICSKAGYPGSGIRR